METSGLVYQCQQINTEEREFQNYPHFEVTNKRLVGTKSKDPITPSYSKIKVADEAHIGG